MIFRKKILLLSLSILLLATIGTVANLGPSRFFPSVAPANAIACPTGGTASPCLTVSLDAMSTPATGTVVGCATTVAGQAGVCKTLITPSATSAKTFRVGAILNSTAGAGSAVGVFGWQFAINYDPTIVTPQGDPSSFCLSYPDCGEKAVWFGSQTAAGTHNWAQDLQGPNAASAIAICENGPLTSPDCPGPHSGRIQVGFTNVGGSTPAVTLTARTVLASVSFEIVGKGTATFTASNVIFVNMAATPIPGITAALPPNPSVTGQTCSGTPLPGNQPFAWCGQVTDTITNNPPIAGFTFSHTGTSYTFASTSTPGVNTPATTISNLVWDFGDKSPIVMGATATTVTHDYGIAGARTAPGAFSPTLRVVDSLGATGTARDATGAIIGKGDNQGAGADPQPSHTNSTLGRVEIGPTASFVVTTTTPTAGAPVAFDASGSTYPDEPVLAGTAPVGGSLLSSSDTGTDACVNNPNVLVPCNFGFIDNDLNGKFDPGVDTVVRDNCLGPALTPCGTFLAGDDIMAGPTITPTGQTILADLKITFWDSGTLGVWDSTKPVIYDTNGNTLYDGIKTWAWDFGDLTPPSTVATPTTTHTFASPGTFTVKLTVTDNVGGSNFVTKSVTVSAGQHSTTTAVSCAPTTIDTSQISVCTAIVTDTGTGPTTPTGTVALSTTGATGTFTTCTLAAGTTAGTATCKSNFTPTSTGTASIIGVYSGDAGHTTSTSPATTVTVNAAVHTTTTTVSCTPASVAVGVATLCTATVMDSFATGATAPTGTVTFTLSGTCTLATPTTNSASCSVSITPTTVANLSVSASYVGDATHATSSGSTTVTVAKRITTTAIACVPNPVIVGSGTICTATVTDTDAGTAIIPSGTVTITSSGTGSILTSPCTLSGTGATATCFVTYTPSGTTVPRTDTITATYSGSANHLTSSNTVSLQVNQVPIHGTTLSVACTPSTVVIGESTSCTATVTDTATTGATTPTGTVAFTPGGTCTLTGTGAIATCFVSVTFTTAGAPKVSATYSGDATHDISTNAIGVTVNLRATSTAVACTPSPVIIGQTSNCTATVADSSPGTSSTPTGTVSWTASIGSFGTTTSCTLTAGSCSVTFSSTTSGSATITGSYAGDTTHAISSNTAIVAVGNLAPTSTSIVCDQTVVAGQPSLCTATITDTSTTGATSPLGTVTWSLGPATQGTASFDSSTCSLVAGTAGISTCSVHVTSQGPGGDNFQIQASYGGSVTHSTSSGSVTFAIPGRATTATITCTTPVTVGTASTCNVTITDTSPPPAVTPTGSFPLTTSGSGFFGPNCLLVGTGAVATCTVNYTPSATGTHAITAQLPIGGAFSYNTAGTFDITANGHPTTSSMVCTPSPTVLYNSNVDCTVTVTDTSATPTTPTGTISFGSNLATAGVTCTLAGSGATATCTGTMTTFGIGPLTIGANYVGDATHAGSGATANLTVVGRPTTTTLTCASVNIGSAGTCTATVTDSSGIPTAIVPGGTVSFTTSGTGTFATSPCALVAGTSGTASCFVMYSPTGTAARTDTITASYVHDAYHTDSSNTATVTVTIAAHNTTTTITCNPTSVLVGQSSNCTATVIDSSVTGATVPTGTVAFTPAGSCTLVAGTGVTASCSVQVTFPFIAPSTVSGTYSGDSNHSGSTGSTSITVNLRPTTTTVSCSPTSVNSGSTTTCTATVTDSSGIAGASTPNGAVAFTSSGSGTFTGTLVPGACALPNTIGTTASCTIQYTPSGSNARTDTITANYCEANNCGTSPAPVHAPSTGTTTVTVTIQQTPPTVSFTESATTAFRGQMITLTITSVPGTGTINTVTVNWGDTTIDTLLGTATTDSHAYNSLGSFKVTVTVTDSNSLTASATATKTIINQLPTVSFTETLTTAPTGTPITLTITVADPDGTVASITVNWGDNTPIDTLAGTATTDAHTYAKAGSYTVTVTATDSDGGKTTAPTATKTITDRPPVATFTESMTTAPTGTLINFNASGSTDPDGTIATYAWNFGDTTTGTGVTVTHAYTKAGSYTVTLTVTDDSGSTAQTTGTKSITDRAPIASFTFTPTSPIVGQTVTFDGTASTDPDGTIASYAWNFGDTTTGTGVTTSHAYTAAGSFTVTLTVTDDVGLTGSTSHTVTVTPQVTNPGHAKLIQWRAEAKYSPDNLRRNPTQVLRAYGQNDGTVTVNVYVRFDITNPDGATNTIYTRVVSLSPGQSINGRSDNRFTASFNPLPGRTSVTATIYYSTTSTTIGDISFNPDTATAKTFSFNAPGTRMDDFNFNDDITSTSQSFDANLDNQANIDLVSRIDVTVRQPDGTNPSYTSRSLLLHTGQSGDITFIIPLTGPDGTYCFTATLKYGIDTNHNGVLDNSEVLGTGGTQRDCFFADTDDVPAGTAIASPLTITHVSTDDE